MNKTMENIAWVVEGKIKEGKRDEFDKVMDLMVEAVRPEDFTSHYEWYVGDDNETVAVYERYDDAPSAVKHVTTSWAANADKFMGVVEITNFVVYSNLTPELEEMVAGLNPVYMRPVGGFAK